MLSLPVLAGCGGVRYLAQAAGGQLSLIRNARPIPEVIRDGRAPPRTRLLLREVAAIKRFGEANGLKPTNNYADYVHLNRPAVVWVVSACEPLRFKPKVWSFPIVGAFPYLGWFDREDAVAFARDLRKESLDVDVRGATAYSTLGWFDDPLLSTMIPQGGEALGQLVNVVLHESVHATLHIPSQSYFNESLASFVADRLTPVYLERTRGAGSPEQLAYERHDARVRQAQKRLRGAYEQLAQLYASDRPDAAKLEEKARVLRELREELGGRREINNATLVGYRTYGVGEAEFDALFRACGEDWARFLAALQTLTPGSFSRPQQEDLSSVVPPLIEKRCPPPPGDPRPVDRGRPPDTASTSPPGAG